MTEVTKHILYKAVTDSKAHLGKLLTEEKPSAEEVVALVDAQYEAFLKFLSQPNPENDSQPKN